MDSSAAFFHGQKMFAYFLTIKVLSEVTMCADVQQFIDVDMVQWYKQFAKPWLGFICVAYN